MNYHLSAVGTIKESSLAHSGGDYCGASRKREERASTSGRAVEARETVVRQEGEMWVLEEDYMWGAHTGSSTGEGE